MGDATGPTRTNSKQVGQGAIARGSQEACKKLEQIDQSATLHTKISVLYNYCERLVSGGKPCPVSSYCAHSAMMHGR